MSHTHRTADGRETSPDIVDPEDAKNHWHTVSAEPTGKTEYGDGHTHIFAGIKTTGPIDGDGEKRLNLKFQVSEIEKKQTIDPNGIPVGIVKGYIATWDVDRGDFFGVQDQFVKGAFRESLADLKMRNRNIRFKDHHGRTVGNFPIQSVFEDDRGLFGEGHLNLEVQQGKEAYSLALQKSLTDFSIGFSADEFVIDDDLRSITKATIWEGSIVDEPMNPAAIITEVKEKITVEMLKEMSPRELEKALKDNNFSKEAAKQIVFKNKQAQDDKEEILNLVESINNDHKSKTVLEQLKQLNKTLTA